MLPYETPIFFTGVGIEFLISLIKKRKSFSLDDSINSISCGAVSFKINACMKVFLKWLSIIPYTYIYNNFSVPWFDPGSLWSLLVLFLAVDFCYYWLHREMHLVNIGWAGHATHHSSEYYNYTTAARQSAFGQVFAWDPILFDLCLILFLPLALFFSPQLYAVHYSANLFFQLWIHTELVGKMPPIIELIFNTPSHHRVHHARNPEYLDKNFGGVLIIWDRMFGTFAEEKTEPIYGLVHPLQTWDVIWAQIHHLVYIFEEMNKCSQLKNKLALVFAPPGWTISEKANSWVAPEIPAIDYTKPVYKTCLPNQITAYLVVRFTVTVFVFNALTTNKFPLPELLFLTMYIVFCLQAYGLLLNKSAYAYSAEVARTVFDFVAAVYFLRNLESTIFRIGLGQFFLPLGLTFYFATSVWLVKLRNQFKTFGSKQKVDSPPQVRVGSGKQ